MDGLGNNRVGFEDDLKIGLGRWRKPELLRGGTHDLLNFLFCVWQRRKREVKDGVGVMKFKEMKLEDVKDPHTLGWSSFILLVKILDIGSVETVVNLLEVELQKNRETFLLWTTDTTRPRENIYTWVSVQWKNKRYLCVLYSGLRGEPECWKCIIMNNR